MIKKLQKLFTSRLIQKRGLRDSGGKWQLAVLIMLLLLLPVLAVMQYNWLGQLSEAEQVRLRSNLELSAKRFAEDFDKELTRVRQAFKLEDDIKTVLPLQLNQAYDNWRQKAALPDLIEDFYLLEFTRDDYRLKLFDKDAKKFIKTEWPRKLSELKKFMPDSSAIIAPMLISLTHAPLFGESALLITECISCYKDTMVHNDKPNMNFNYLVIVLSTDVINKNLLPALKENYFPYSEDMQFDIAMAAADDTAKVFYISNPDLNISDFANPDVRAEIGRWRTQDFMFARATVVGNDSSTTKIARKVENRSISRSLSIEVIQADSIEESRLFKFMISRTPTWELLVKHHHGSLESIVNKSRNRNLLISYGILLLLGISMTMVFISTRRARKLIAKQVKFVAGVGHELRTPLSVIRSAGENLAEGVITDPEQLKKYGQTIRNEGRRLSAMVEQTLDFSGIQNDQRKFHFQAVCVTELLKESIHSIKDSNSLDHQAIELQYDDNLPPVSADSASLKTAFENLISNALKYCLKDEPVNIRVKKDSKSDRLEIRFEDQGFGIDLEDLPHVFKPFYRGKNNDAGQIPGSGLGLSLVKEIIELHGGEVRVVSQLDKGSIFTVYLPATSNDSLAEKTDANE